MTGEDPEKVHDSKILDRDSDMIKLIRSDFDGVIEEASQTLGSVTTEGHREFRFSSAGDGNFG